MGDIPCSMCGEPWDYYGLKHGDVEPGEAERILNGEGCPCCNFGKDKEKCRYSHVDEHFAGLLNHSEGNEIMSIDWGHT